ncbi:MAG: TAXI family TRAP transporter solute-binding subunit, partial [Bacteroidota bacterium]
MLNSCAFSPGTFTISTGTKDSRHYKVGLEIKKLVEEKTTYTVKLDTNGAGSMSNCQQLIERKVDFALAQNDVPLPNFKGDLRTVLPLYPQLFFVIYADSLQPKNLKDLIIGRKIAIGPATGGTAPFTRRFLHLMGIDSTEYEFIYSSYHENTLSDSISISISVTGFNSPRIAEMLTQKNGKIWSLDDPQLSGSGSLVDGLCLQYPYARPFIIPKNTYQHLPQEPALTIALDNVLLAHKSVDDHIVYDQLHTLLNNKELLINDDALYGFIHDNFEKESLQFPLHHGAIDYLNRYKPSFYERYAELVALFITLITLLIGGFSTLWRWNKRRKKERIDNYYLQVIQLENRAKESPNTEELLESLEELDL